MQILYIWLIKLFIPFSLSSTQKLHAKPVVVLEKINVELEKKKIEQRGSDPEFNLDCKDHERVKNPKKEDQDQ